MSYKTATKDDLRGVAESLVGGQIAEMQEQLTLLRSDMAEMEKDLVLREENVDVLYTKVKEECTASDAAFDALKADINELRTELRVLGTKVSKARVESKACNIELNRSIAEGRNSLEAQIRKQAREVSKHGQILQRLLISFAKMENEQ